MTPETPVRLILDGHETGRTNMDRDEWLLRQGMPVLRLYGWEPACVSLGRTQTEADIDTDAAARHGVDVVPRVTGGGAILHNEVEVTYGVVLPLDHPGSPKNILESYRFIAGPLIDAFDRLGVDASFEEGKGGRDTLCYLREEGVSVFVDGRKISGGAQRRSRDAVLQHGTMVLRLDAARTAEVLRAPRALVEKKVTGLDVLGVDLDREQVIAAIVSAYEDAWGPLETWEDPWSGMTDGSEAEVATPEV